MTDGWTTAAIEAIGKDSFRDESGPQVPIPQTEWALSCLTYDALGRLQTFLADLAKRPPMIGPAFQAHREVIEALASDIEKHRVVLYYDELHAKVPA